MRIKPLRKEKAFFSLILVLWLTTTVYSSVAPPLDPDDSQQCTGLMLDFQRIKSVTNNDLQTVTQSLFPATGNDDNDDSNANKTSDKSYGINYIIPVQQQDTLECIMQRHRLQETKEGVPILGADIVITVKDCAPPDEYAFGGGYEQSPLSGIPLQAISDLDGITFTEVNEPKGYVPTKTRDEVRQSIAERYTIAQDKMGALDLILFPSTVGDFLSYKTEVMVVQPGDIQLYDVIVSAHTLDFLSICKKTRAHNQRIERHRELLLRGGTKDNNNIQQSANSRRLREQLNCQSCATLTSTHSDGEEIEWSEEEISCPINSLYLNDTGRTTTCVKGIAPDGQEVFGPGTVAKLFYDGTYDCMGSDTRCVANPFPTNCSDAISDIHYGVTETLRYYQRHLGVMGGLRVNANNPLRFISLAHYSTNYCNAFFTTQTNNLYFGDCDCNLWTPLTSLDVAAHELTHGITSYSSNLYYAYQPGGLNEGYSDIMGTVIEYYINDSIDTPDFTMGEKLGDKVLRDMENPPRDGTSIDHVCDYRNDRTVHHTSGVLNKAFVKSVRACEDSACSDERGCVLLLGPLFMYANIQKLTQLSGYMDSATKTCKVVEEFFTAKKPNTVCTANQVIQFVKDGWSQVGLELDDDCVGSIPECELSAAPQIEGLPDGGGTEEDEDDGCILFSLIRWPFQATFNVIRLPFSWLFREEDEAAESSINGEIDPSQT